MNLSLEKESLEMSCDILGTTHFVITKLPSEKLMMNHIFAVAFNAILTIPTILLNAIAAITILKSSQLNNKPCYFIILVQSVIDLAVGVLGIPSFIVFLAGGMGGNSNCLVAILAVKSSVIPYGISTITLSAATLERYIAILHPYVYTSWVTKKRLLIYTVCGVALTLSAIVLSLRNNRLFEIFATVIVTVHFIFTAFAYTRIFLIVKKLVRSSKKLHDAGAAKNLSKMKLLLQEIKQAKSCFLVVICFCALVFLPPAIAVPLFASLDKFDRLAIAVWVGTLGLVNSSANSVIYFWTKKLLRREAVKKLNRISLC